MMTKLQELESRSMLITAHRDYHYALKQHSFFKLRDRALGGDLVQDTFTKTWSYLARGGKIHVMKAFLYHVLNNLIVDEYRKRKTLSLDVLLEKGFEPQAAPSSLFDRIDSAAVLALIRQLPVKYQAVIKMRYIQDLSLKEIALLTGMTKNILAVHAHRGLIKLKALYAAEQRAVTL